MRRELEAHKGETVIVTGYLQSWGKVAVTTHDKNFRFLLSTVTVEHPTGAWEPIPSDHLWLFTAPASWDKYKLSESPKRLDLCCVGATVERYGRKDGTRDWGVELVRGLYPEHFFRARKYPSLVSEGRWADLKHLLDSRAVFFPGAYGRLKTDPGYIDNFYSDYYREVQANLDLLASAKTSHRVTEDPAIKGRRLARSKGFG